MFYDGGIGYDSQSSYVDENGELIKIVRMRKEEIINCICGYYEEDGLMIQCELCLCWQHGGCNGIEKENQVPEKYVCYICKNPLKARASQKYIHDQDWLYDGKLPIASYHVPNPKQTARFDKLKQCHTLIGNLREMEKYMHSLKVKKNIAAKRGHPKMYLWSKKWEASPTRQAQYMQTDDVKKNIKKELKFEDEEKPQIVVPSAPEPEAAIDPAKCQRILLGHIEKQLKMAKSRYAAIEEQVAGEFLFFINLFTFLQTYFLCLALEAMSEQKTPESDAKTKQTIYMLLNDLSKMRKIASIHTTPGV
jgi:PHD finger protein 20